MEASIYYIARMKDDYICFLLEGPYFDMEHALAQLSSKYSQKRNRRTYESVVEVVQNFRKIEDYNA